MGAFVVSPELTVQDVVVLQNLIDDISRYESAVDGDEGYVSQESLDKDKKSTSDESICMAPRL